MENNEFLFNLGVLTQEANRKIIMVTCYDKPKDFPTKYVARAFIVDKEPRVTDLFFTADTVEELHAGFSDHFVWFCREELDDVNIIGTYML